MNTCKPFLLYSTLALFFFSTSYAQNDPVHLEYQLLPGMDLIFTSTIDLDSTGEYGVQSLREIESRFIVLDVDETGTAALFGISKMAAQIMEGQSIEPPYGNIYTYQWTWNPKTSKVHIPSTSTEFGTGWTPMICFPPLPHQPIAQTERLNTKLPVYLNMKDDFEAEYSVFMQPHPSDNNKINIAASLSKPASLPERALISLEYQEHEITYHPLTKLPEHSLTGYQLKMQDGNEVAFADIRIETTLTQSNLFREEHRPVIKEEIAKFITYQNQLEELDLYQADEIVNLLVDFSENSPMPLLRDGAEDLVMKHRYELRLERNLSQSLPGWEIPLFEAETMDGEDYIFNPKEKKVRVLLFWSLWWDPAERALLDLEALRKTLNAKNVEFIGINLDKNRSGIALYLKQTEIEMLTLWDQHYPKSGTAFRFGVSQVPVIMVIDDDGVIAARDVPFSELVKLLDRLL